MNVSYPFGKALLSAARLIPLKRPNSSDPDAYGESIRQRARTTYETFYSRYLPFEGKDIGELGGGGFAMREFLKHSPAHYYPINVYFGDEDFEGLEAELASGEVTPVKSTRSSIPLPDASLDALVSENCFEHLEDYRGMASEMHRVLRPGGYVLTHFSPLYFSPYGAHFHEVTKLPYVHLLTDDETLARWIREELHAMGRDSLFDYLWNQYKTLNRLTPREFLAPLLGGQWEVLCFETWPFRRSDEYPGAFSKWLTHGIRLAARRK